MRLFSALPVPEAIKNSLIEITRGKLPVPYLNLTNAHITLNFFGELDTDQSNKAIKSFEHAAKNHKKIAIEFDKIVRFHQQLHLTLKINAELKALQQDLENGFLKLGFVLQNREYYPHVTLARMHMDNHLYRQRKVESFPHKELEQLNFVADSVILYESKLLLHHAHHTPLVEVPLN